MAISEAARADLYNALSGAIGEAPTETLMSAIPIYDLDEVATKRDIDSLRRELRSEIDSLRSQMRSQIDSLRSEMGSQIDSLRSEMGSQIDSLRSEMGSQIDSLRSDMESQGDLLGSGFKAEITAQVAQLQRTMSNWMIVLLITIIGAMVGVNYLPG